MSLTLGFRSGEQAMREKWIGMKVSWDRIEFVHAATAPNKGFTVVEEHTWSLGTLSRSAEYLIMGKRVAEYAIRHGIARAVLNATEVRPAQPRRKHFETAELRGVVMSGLAETADVDCVLKSGISRSLFGSRTVRDVLADEEVWSAVNVTTGYREPMIYLFYKSGKYSEFSSSAKDT